MQIICTQWINGKRVANERVLVGTRATIEEYIASVCEVQKAFASSITRKEDVITIENKTARTVTQYIIIPYEYYGQGARP